MKAELIVNAGCDYHQAVLELIMRDSRMNEQGNLQIQLISVIKEVRDIAGSVEIVRNLAIMTYNVEKPIRVKERR